MFTKIFKNIYFSLTMIVCLSILWQNIYIFSSNLRSDWGFDQLACPLIEHNS